MIDQVMDRFIITQSGKMLFYFFNRGFSKGFIVNKIPDGCFISLLNGERDCSLQFHNSLVFSWIYGHYGYTQFPLKCGDVNLDPLLPGQVHHGQHHHHRHFQVNDLGTEKQVSFQVAGIGHSHHHIGFDFFVFPDQDFITHPFIQPLGVKAVGAGQVDKFSAETAKFSCTGFFVHGHSGKIAHLLIQTSQAVKQGTLSAVGIPDQGDMWFILFHLSDSSLPGRQKYCGKGKQPYEIRFLAGAIRKKIDGIMAINEQRNRRAQYLCHLSIDLLCFALFQDP